MVTKTKINFYISYLIFSAIWLGAAFHDSFSTNYTWFVDPMRHIHFTTEYTTPGALNPWPLSTVFLLIFTVIAFMLFRKYQGPGKREIAISIYGTLIVFAATGIYFVPTLGKIFGENNSYTSESLITMSRMWVVLNIVRFGLLVFLFTFGLRGLTKLSNALYTPTRVKYRHLCWALEIQYFSIGK